MNANETRDALAELISSSLHDSRGDDPRDSSAYVAGMILDALPELGYVKADDVARTRTCDRTRPRRSAKGSRECTKGHHETHH